MAEEQHDAGRELIILGDFNDFDGAPDSRDHVDNLPIATVMSLLPTYAAARRRESEQTVATSHSVLRSGTEAVPRTRAVSRL